MRNLRPWFRFLVVALIALLGPISQNCLGETVKKRAAYPPTFLEAREQVYKRVGDTELKLFLFMPEDHKPTDKRPAIVFFFGGGWRSGSPAQFHAHCKHFAALGMVAATADYRVLSRNQTPATECVADGKSAVRWLRQNASNLGIDPTRIVASGGSAGGHVAACTSVIEGYDDQNEDAAISSEPNALILFNPALVLAPVDGQHPLAEKIQRGLRERMGTDPKNLSPLHHVREKMPPTIIFHGQGDTTVPYRTAELFTTAMKKAGNDCTLVGYADQPHGFFNYGRSGNQYYNETNAEAEAFLKRLGYLPR